jgi:hypothetical protein
MDTEYFAEQISPSLVSICCPNGRRFRQRKCILRFGNARIHKSKVVSDKLTEEGLKRMLHPVYSPDLSPCDFLLFGLVKDKLIDQQYARREELFSEVETIIPAIP